MEVSADLAKHEAVCTERWLETIHRINRLEMFVISTLIVLVLGMGGILGTQIF
jgi:hypothetical protein|tara:strand:+ start:424 stop:582 length:159 start_codon:yes stop_codon:yes gene_type:complete